MKNTQRLLKKNLALLHKRNARLALKLNFLDPSDLIICETHVQEPNLQRTHQGETYFYHAPQSAQLEANKWFKTLKLQNTSVLCIYGIGLGYYYEALLPWLKKNRQSRVLFFEEDPAVIYRLCETSLGSKLLKDQQVQLYYLPDLANEAEIWNELSWTYIDDQVSFSALKLYLEVNEKGFDAFEHQFSHELIQKRAFVDEYLDYGIVFFRNFYPNLLELPSAYLGSALFQQFAQVPAIICGAGPSLSPQIKELAHLKDKALIFAGGSALNALIPQGIKPHFGVAIDPNQAQYARVAVAKDANIPFFYRNRLFHRALQNLTGPRLYLSGTGGYEITEWFDEQLKTQGEVLDEGHNVVNLSMEIARAMGCNPIILIGVDLAFTSEHFYAQGVMENLNLTKADLKVRDSLDDQPILTKDIKGQPIYTFWKWLTEAKWITEFANKYPHINLINATEGGIGFDEVKNLSLKEVEQQYLKQNQIKIKQLDDEICQVPLNRIKIEQIIAQMGVLQNSLEQCIHLLTKLLGESESMIDQIKNKQQIPDSLENSTILLLETEIAEEIGYRYILDTFNQIYIRWRQRTLQDLQKKQAKPSKTHQLKKLKLQCQRLTFLRDVARINWELIRWTLKEHQIAAEV
jgi:hypothetical protein